MSVLLICDLILLLPRNIFCIIVFFSKFGFPWWERGVAGSVHSHTSCVGISAQAGEAKPFAVSRVCLTSCLPRCASSPCCCVSPEESSVLDSAERKLSLCGTDFSWGSCQFLLVLLKVSPPDVFCLNRS